MVACAVVTLEAVSDGEGIPQRQVLPAMLMAAALIVRQYSTSRERQQLVGELRQRELSLEAELRQDALTGLANRVAMMERLTAALDRPAPVADRRCRARPQ